MNKQIKKLLKHNKKLMNTIKERDDLIDYLFKRIEDWGELVKDQSKHIEDIFKLNLKYITYCSVLLITNIITITFLIVYIIGGLK